MVNPPVARQARSASRAIHRRLSSLRIQDAQLQRPLTFSPPEKSLTANNTTPLPLSRITAASFGNNYDASSYASQNPNGGYVQQMLLSTFSSHTHQVLQNIKIMINDDIFAPAFSSSPPGTGTGELPLDHPFTRFHLLVGEITSCELHPTAERLYIQKVKLSCVTLNDRTIVSGLRPFFPTPESLIGQKCIVVANMPKRKLRGVWSEGMLLCGSKKIGDAGAAVELLRPPSNAKPGERVIATGQTVSSNPIDSMKSKS
ncbi:Tyrosine--tRNA ligase, cytoplasmic, partial [Neolecta irregularis DAH-3]